LASDFVIAETPVAAAPRAGVAKDDLGWTASVLVVMTALLALFNAASLRSWAETLPPTPANLAVYHAAEQWYDATAHLGLAAPRAAIRSLWTQARAAKFPTQAR
jgi:hypothetical protein